MIYIFVYFYLVNQFVYTHDCIFQTVIGDFLGENEK